MEKPEEGQETETTSVDLNSFLQSEEGQKALRPYLDREVQKALRTYKEKTVPNLVQENLKETLKGLFPDLKEDVSDPLQALSQKVDSLIEENHRSKAEAFAVQKAQEFGLPSDVALNLLSDDLNQTEERLKTVAGLLQKSKESALEEYAKTNSRTVSKSTGQMNEMEALQQQLTEAEKKNDFALQSAINRKITELKHKEA